MPKKHLVEVGNPTRTMHYQQMTKFVIKASISCLISCLILCVIVATRLTKIPQTLKKIQVKKKFSWENISHLEG